MADPDLSDIKRRMDGALDALHREFAGLRTGRASIGLLEPIMVPAYGASMPLNQVGTIGVPEPRMITVQVWDKSLVSAVDKAIRDLPLPSSAVHITRLFGPGAPLATISNNLGKIRGEISLMNSTRCKRGTFCYSSCAAGSIASFSPSGNFYTFCERYFRYIR